MSSNNEDLLYIYNLMKAQLETLESIVNSKFHKNPGHTSLHAKTLSDIGALKVDLRILVDEVCV